jgi:hypothetical protein
MEFYRLGRDNVIDYGSNIYEQLQEHYQKYKGDISRIVAGVNSLHQKGQMSSQEQGWNVVRALYRDLEIPYEGYLGGEVILAPFDVQTIAQIPKTVYAFNPMFFVCESFEQMDALLDAYLKPISQRSN